MAKRKSEKIADEAALYITACERYNIAEANYTKLCREYEAMKGRVADARRELDAARAHGMQLAAESGRIWRPRQMAESLKKV